MRFAILLTLVHASAVLAGPPDLANIPFAVEQAKVHQAVWARELGVEPRVINSLGMKLVVIPPGRFTMGPNGSTYRVTLGKPFLLGVTEVTLGEYRRWKPDHRVPDAEGAFNADDRPAALVSWEEANGFCEWLSEQPEEKAAGRQYSLPTEARWEWAARAGTATTRWFGDDEKRQKEFSWFNDTYTPNPKHETGERGRRAVAKLPANPFGLHDMLGNVWEWCGDRRSDEQTGEVREPVMRGGSWRSGAFHCTAVAHDPGDPNLRGDNIGFRVVCTLDTR